MQKQTQSPQSTKKAATKTKTSGGKKKTRARGAARKQQLQIVVGVPKECTVDYLKAVTNPFAFRIKGSQGVCIPDLFDQPSYKFSTFFRTTVSSSSTTGAAFVEIDPFCFSNAAGELGYVTTQTYAGLIMPPALATGVSGITDSQFPWSNLEPRQTRLVACGLKVRYIGTQLNMGGTVLPYSACGLGDDLKGLNNQQVASRPDSRVWNWDRTWRGCIYRPMFSTANEYVSNIGGITTNPARMGVFIVGAAMSQPYEVEVCRFFESIANINLNVPNTSRSHSDTEGISEIREFLGQVSSSEIGQSLQDEGIKYLKGVMGSVTTASAAATAAYLLSR